MHPPVCIKFYIQPTSLLLLFSPMLPRNFPTPHPPPGNYCTVPKKEERLIVSSLDRDSPSFLEASPLTLTRALKKNKRLLKVLDVGRRDE